jgi:hypothetical protein
MAEEKHEPTIAEPVIDEATRQKAEECIEAEDGATHRFKGAWGMFLRIVAVAKRLFQLYAASEYITTTTRRDGHVGGTHGQGLLYTGGEFRQLACSSPQAVTCDGPYCRNSRRIRPGFGL